VTTFEGGNRASRPVSLTRWTPLAMVIPMSAAEAASLIAWRDSTLPNPAARFTMPIYRTGEGYVDRETMIPDGMTVQADGRRWIASARFIVKNL